MGNPGQAIAFHAASPGDLRKVGCHASMNSMHIATWNVNSLNVRLPHVLEYLEENNPDILALQETKLPDERFPATEIEQAGYHVCFSGQKTYNGVAIISRAPATDCLGELPGLDDPQRRLLAATIDGIRIVNVYIPNGQEVGSEKFAYKLRWLASLKPFLQNELESHQKLVLLGDYNIAPQDIDVYDPKRWHGKIMCSDIERAAFRDLLALELVDVVRNLYPDDPMHSWWDYRLAAFQRGWGIRIDHLLATPNLFFAKAGVDTGMRDKERPSDHAPVWAVTT